VQTTIEEGTCAVRGDLGQLEQVLLQLCMNARDAMPNGGLLRIRASNSTGSTPCSSGAPPSEARVSCVLLEVQDAGTGLAPAVRERLFEPFVSTKKDAPGSGLGLFAAFRIIQKHGGCIMAASEAGKATTFRVLLPATFERPSPVGEGRDPKSSAQGEWILVAENDANQREMARAVLTENGYEVLGVSDGAQALAALRQHAGRIRVAFLDLMLPVMDGPSVAHWAREHDPQLGIIAASRSGTSSDPAGKLAALQTLGIGQLLVKPYTALELLQAVERELHPPSKQILKEEEKGAGAHASNSVGGNAR
jgi:CheY-like chemotaxis protein